MKLKLTDLLNSKILNIKNIINVIIILITFFIAVKLVKLRIEDIVSLKDKREEEIKKNKLLDNISQLEKEVNDYKNIFNKNKKEMSSVLDMITNIANKSAVKVISIRPKKEQNYPQYIKYSFDLVIGANNYHAVGQFISSLENYSQVYTVDRLSIILVEGAGSLDGYRGLGQGQEGLQATYSLDVNLTLGIVVVKG